MTNTTLQFSTEASNPRQTSKLKSLVLPIYKYTLYINQYYTTWNRPPNKCCWLDSTARMVYLIRPGEGSTHLGQRAAAILSRLQLAACVAVWTLDGRVRADHIGNLRRSGSHACVEGPGESQGGVGLDARASAHRALVAGRAAVLVVRTALSLHAQQQPRIQAQGDLQL